MNNRWLWFHILAGGILAKLFLLFETKFASVFWVFMAATAYEMYQWISGEHRDLRDSIEDILGAVIMAGIIII